jgi:hypothetical protein
MIYDHFYKINGSQLLSTILTAVVITMIAVALLTVMFGITVNIIGITFPFIGAWIFTMVIIAAIMFAAAIIGGY